MGDRQQRLLKAVRDEMFAQGLTNKQMAAAIGTSNGHWSMSINGQHNMAEEKWRMACEKLGLDYDAIIMEKTEPEPAEEKQGEPDVEPEQEEAPVSEADDDLTYDNIILADYALEKLRLDIRQGTDMQPKRLYELMRAIERSGAMTIV